jgi:hypothetical protein
MFSAEEAHTSLKDFLSFEGLLACSKFLAQYFLLQPSAQSVVTREGQCDHNNNMPVLKLRPLKFTRYIL